MKQKKIVYPWKKRENQKGIEVNNFIFTCIVLLTARQHVSACIDAGGVLNIPILWFGSYKNSMFSQANSSLSNEPAGWKHGPYWQW